MRAKAGPYQGDVIYSEHDGPPPWLRLGVQVRTDSKNRPVVSFASFKTGQHSMVLDNGKWVEQRDENPNAPADDSAVANTDDEAEPQGKSLAKKAKSLNNLSKFNLPYEVAHLDGGYLRDTGNFLYTVKGARPTRVKLVLSKPVQQ